MKNIVNTGIILSARKFLLQELSKPDIALSSMEIYSLIHTNKNLPDTFILVKTVGSLLDIGNVDVDGTLEVCIYAKNLEQGDDQTQPDLSTLDGLVKKIMPVLNDAIFEDTAITSIAPQLVSDSTNRYFYYSLICETKSVKS